LTKTLSSSKTPKRTQTSPSSLCVSQTRLTAPSRRRPPTGPSPTRWTPPRLLLSATSPQLCLFSLAGCRPPRPPHRPAPPPADAPQSSLKPRRRETLSGRRGSRGPGHTRNLLPCSSASPSSPPPLRPHARVPFTAGSSRVWRLWPCGWSCSAASLRRLLLEV
jgi:hypothetical protein